MRGITKRFGGTVALSEVDFDVLTGEIHGLVGQNGAGKSTLMKIVAGDYRPDNGRIFLDGREVEIRDPRRGLDLGVGIVYQELSLLSNLTVAENISLGREETSLALVGRDAEMRLAGKALALLGIDHITPSVRVNRLTVAEQQLVEIAKTSQLGTTDPCLGRTYGRALAPGHAAPVYGAASPVRQRRRGRVREPPLWRSAGDLRPLHRVA